MAYEAHVEGAPTEGVVRRLIEEARAAGADVVEIETTHEDGEAWIRAGFTETARVLQAPVDALDGHLGAGGAPSFGSIHVQTDDVDAVVRRCASSCRGFRAARREAWCFRRTTGGRPLTTSSPTGAGDAPPPRA